MSMGKNDKNLYVLKIDFGKIKHPFFIKTFRKTVTNGYFLT